MSSAHKNGEDTIQLTVTEPGGGMRLDKYLAETLGLLSRSQLKQRLIGVMVNGKSVKVSRILAPQDEVQLELAALPEINLTPENLSLDVIFENEDVLVVNKPPGMVVHPAAGNHTGTLVHGLLFHLQELKNQDFDDENRPGIVHRLDKGTSGVLIVAKNVAAHEFLATQFQARTTLKTYLAIGVGSCRFQTKHVEGFLHRDPKNRQRFVHDPQTGKSAATDFEVLAQRSGFCLLKAHPLTGRTHQIRVHAKHIGLPLLGDSGYGKPVSGYLDARLMLHALHLEICLPGQDCARRFSAPVPDDMMDIVRRLGFAEAVAAHSA